MLWNGLSTLIKIGAKWCKSCVWRQCSERQVTIGRWHVFQWQRGRCVDYYSQIDADSDDNGHLELEFINLIFLKIYLFTLHVYTIICPKNMFLPEHGIVVFKWEILNRLHSCCRISHGGTIIQLHGKNRIKFSWNKYMFPWFKLVSKNIRKWNKCFCT